MRRKRRLNRRLRGRGAPGQLFGDRPRLVERGAGKGSTQPERRWHHHQPERRRRAPDTGAAGHPSGAAGDQARVELEQGYISGTDAQANPVSNDQIRTGVVSFMVPASKFDETIDALSNLGKVQTVHITGNDVSAQYVDLQARLANEEAQRNAMLALLAKAQTVEQIIMVQNQIGQITGQIEQLKGQINYIDHNVAFSTITVQLTEAGAPVATAPTDSWGFASAVADAAHNFVTTINYIVTVLGALGPVLILLGLGYLVWRRAGRPGWRRA